MKIPRHITAFCFLVACLLPCGCPHRRSRPHDNFAAQIAARQEAKDRSIHLYGEGMAAYRANDRDKAYTFLTDAVAVDERNELAWMVLGVLEFERDNLFEAVHAFHRAARLAPLRYEPHFNLGTIYEFIGRYTHAIKAYERALELAPDRVEVMENLARCYIRANENLDKAADLVDRALRVEHRPEWRTWLERQALRLSVTKRNGNEIQPVHSEWHSLK